MVNKFRIVIDNIAKHQLKDVYEYIRNDSPQNAEKVKSKILSSIKALNPNPEIHPPDKYRI